jgi:hypothetical protein
MSDDEPIPAFCRIPQDERRSAWARWDAKHKEDAVKAGPKEEQIRALRAQQDANRKLKSRGRIEKLKAKLSGATKAMPLVGAAALQKIAEASAPTKIAVDQALARAQGRNLDAAMLSPNWPTAPAAAQQETTTMKTSVNSKPNTSKKTVKKAARKAPAASKAKAATSKPSATKNAQAAGSGREDGLRPNSKQAVMLDLVLRPEGATEKVICKKLGWKKCRVTLKRVCDKVGATLVGEKTDDEGTVYRATLPKTKTAAA